MPASFSNENIPPNNEPSDHESSSDDDQQQLSQRNLKRKNKTKENTTGIEFTPYLNAASWFQRSYGTDIIWAAVLLRGVSWDFKTYAPFTKTEFESKFKDQITAYNSLMEFVPALIRDRNALQRSSSSLELLGTQMVDVSNQARSNDIYNLKDKFLQYLSLEYPDSTGVIPTKPDKSDRGFKNVLTAQLLIPIRLREQFDQDPEVMMAEIENGKVQRVLVDENEEEIHVDETEFPSFMWPEGGYDPTNPDEGLLCSPLLVRVFRHVFTTPSSALKQLEKPTSARVQGLAKRNKMTTVTPASIAYACIMLRHAASRSIVWAQEDRSFNYQNYHSLIMKLFDKEIEGAEINWIDTTLKWWNVKVFGSESGEPGAAALVPQKRGSKSTFNDIMQSRAKKRQARINNEQLNRSMLPATSAHNPLPPSHLPTPASTQSSSVHRAPTGSHTNPPTPPSSHQIPIDPALLGNPSQANQPQGNQGNSWLDDDSGPQNPYQSNIPRRPLAARPVSYNNSTRQDARYSTQDYY